MTRRDVVHDSHSEQSTYDCLMTRDSRLSTELCVRVCVGGDHLMPRKAVVPRTTEPRIPVYNAETKHVGVSTTKQSLLAPSGKQAFHRRVGTTTTRKDDDMMHDSHSVGKTHTIFQRFACGYQGGGREGVPRNTGILTTRGRYDMRQPQCIPPCMLQKTSTLP